MGQWDMGQAAQQTSALHDVFDIRSANDWIRVSKINPARYRLLGDLWREGELAVLFGDSGTGKSAFAFQIAESIARGRPLKPFEEVSSIGRKVLYLSLEMTDRQFHLRYSPGKETSQKHYQFSERLRRVSVRAEFLGRPDTSIRESFGSLIEPLVRETGASVLIIDSIGPLMRTAGGGRDLLALMEDLYRLKMRSNVSILLVAGVSGRTFRSRPLKINDLFGWRTINNYADSIFAIGQSSRRLDERYIKQIKARSCEPAIGDDLSAFLLKKIDGNFLGMEFSEFATESELLNSAAAVYDPGLVEKIRQLSAKGLTVRDIADEVRMSKSTVHRIIVGSQRMSALESHVDPEFDPVPHPSKFPGCEVFDERLRDPKFDAIFTRHDPEALELRREMFRLESERSRAMNSHRRGSRHDEHVPPDIKQAVDSKGPPDTAPPEVNNAPSLEITPFGPGLKRRLDGYGREIFVEEEDARGKPIIWYRLDHKGNRFRSVRKGETILVDHLPRE